MNMKPKPWGAKIFSPWMTAIMFKPTHCNNVRNKLNIKFIKSMTYACSCFKRKNAPLSLKLMLASVSNFLLSWNITVLKVTAAMLLSWQSHVVLLQFLFSRLKMMVFIYFSCLQFGAHVHGLDIKFTDFIFSFIKCFLYLHSTELSPRR